MDCGRNCCCFLRFAANAAAPLAFGQATDATGARISQIMIRKLGSGKYRLYSLKKDPKTGSRRNLGTFSSLAKAKSHERAVQFFKKH